MPIPDESPKITVDCNGVLKTFEFPFKILAETDIKVELTTSSGGTRILDTTEYTVALNDQIFIQGGSITTTDADAFASGNTLTIYRDMVIDQELQLIYNEETPSQPMTNAYDRAIMILQQLAEKQNRAIEFPISEDTGGTMPALEIRKDTILGFDSNGDLSITQSFAPEGKIWVTDTAYIARDIIKDESTGNWYWALETFTSLATVQDDIDAGHMELLFDMQDVKDYKDDAEAAATAAAASAATAEEYGHKYIENLKTLTGEADQILTNDGAGNLSWEDSADTTVGMTHVFFDIEENKLPIGWKARNGQALLKADFPIFYAWVQNNATFVSWSEWNNGNNTFYCDEDDGDTDYFRLPDDRGYFIRIQDKTGVNFSWESGRLVGETEEEMLHSHKHIGTFGTNVADDSTYTEFGHDLTADKYGKTAGVNQNSATYRGWTNDGTNNADPDTSETVNSPALNDGTGANVGTETRPPNILAISAVYVGDGSPLPLNVEWQNALSDPNIGEIHFFAHDSLPLHHLACNGGEVSKTTYPELYTVIGDAWGTPADPANFKLPPAAGKFFRALGGNAAALGTAQAEMIHNHKHVTASGNAIAYPGDFGSSVNGTHYGIPSLTGGRIHDWTNDGTNNADPDTGNDPDSPTLNDGTGANIGAETRPENIAFQCAIQYQSNLVTGRVATVTWGTMTSDKPPTNTVLADGGTLSKTTYSFLWQFVSDSNNIGYTIPEEVDKEAGKFYNVDDDYFGVPNLSGRYIRMSDGIDVPFGEAQEDQFQSHLHESTEGVYCTDSGGTLVTTDTGAQNLYYELLENIITGYAADGADGTPRTGDETRPKTVVLNAFVYYI